MGLTDKFDKANKYDAEVARSQAKAAYASGASDRDAQIAGEIEQQKRLEQLQQFNGMGAQSQQPQPQSQFANPQDQQMQEQAKMQAIFQSLPPEAQQQVAQMSPEEQMQVLAQQEQVLMQQEQPQEGGSAFVQ
jgi:hypothetical protein